MGYKSTETRLLLGEAALDELASKEKEEKQMPTTKVNNKPAAQNDDDSDSGLEFEGGTGEPKKSFKDFLATRKISFTDRFGKQAASKNSIAGSATDLTKRRKTIQDWSGTRIKNERNIFGQMICKF